MNTLEAVNLILRKAGGMQAKSLDTDGTSNVAEAERCLDEEELRIQTMGWAYNTVHDDELTPDGDGYIHVPTGTLTIDSDTIDKSRNVTQRGGRLYDLDNNTYDFGDDTLRVTYVLRFDFDCIPLPVRIYIALQAAWTFYTNKPDGQQKAIRLATLKADLDRAQTQAVIYDDASDNNNVLDSASARKLRGRSSNNRTVIDENG